jgi:MoxR-like ATPase
MDRDVELPAAPSPTVTVAPPRITAHPHMMPGNGGCVAKQVSHRGSGSVVTMTPDTVAGALTRHGYLPDEGISTAVFLAMTLHRPLLLEGEAGVGKTELAKTLATATGGALIRLQCYEGIDVSQAVYDWDYARQLLHLRATEATGESATRTADELESELYGERFLVKRALLRAIEPVEGPPPVLLIDEIDRADDEFEAYLLEVLSDFQITIPEVGVFRAERPPIVILTSNRTRDVHDALKRRCLYHWVEHPGFEREVAIVKLRVPGIEAGLARQVAGAVEALRGLSLYKPPGVAETIDWATALGRLGATELDEHVVANTLGTVVKYREDNQRVEQHGVAHLVQQAIAAGRAHQEAPGQLTLDGA